MDKPTIVIDDLHELLINPPIPSKKSTTRVKRIREKIQESENTSNKGRHSKESRVLVDGSGKRFYEVKHGTNHRITKEYAHFLVNKKGFGIYRISKLVTTPRPNKVSKERRKEREKLGGRS